MTSPATMRLMGLLVIVGMVAGCGGDDAAPSRPHPDVSRARIRADALIGTWVADADQLRAAFLAHLATEMEACAAVREKAAVEEMRRRQEQEYVRVLDSFADSALTLSSDGAFLFREGFALDFGGIRGTWGVRGSEVTLNVLWRPEGWEHDFPFYLEIRGGLLHLVRFNCLWGQRHRIKGEPYESPIFFRPDEVDLRRVGDAP